MQDEEIIALLSCNVNAIFPKIFRKFCDNSSPKSSYANNGHYSPDRVQRVESGVESDDDNTGQ